MASEDDAGDGGGIAPEVAGALRNLVREFGSALAGEPNRVRALLNDSLGATAPRLRSSVNAIVIAAEEARGEHLLTPATMLARVTARGLDHTTAEAAISAWYDALSPSAEQTQLPRTQLPPTELPQPGPGPSLPIPPTPIPTPPTPIPPRPPEHVPAPPRPPECAPIPPRPPGHVPAPPIPPRPPERAPTSPEHPPDPQPIMWWRKPAALVGAGAAALIVLIIAITLVVGGDDSNPLVTSASTTTGQQSTTSLPETTVAPTPLLPGTTAPPPPAATGEFVALAPGRVADSRSGVGMAAGKKQVATIDLGSKLPLVTVKSAALNVTVAEPGATGYLTVHPTGTAVPSVSQLAFDAGRTVSTLIITKLSASGQIDLRFSATTGHIVVDLLGYFTQTATPDGLSMLPEPRPVPLLDTRTIAAVGAGATVDLTLPGGQRGALLGVTATRARASGYLTVYSGAARPDISTVNFTPQIDATALSLIAASDSKVRIYNGSNGTIDIIVFELARLSNNADAAPVLNVESTVSTANMASRYPFRTFDSRNNNSRCSSALGGGVTNISNIFPKAKALLVSVTVANATVDSYLQIYTGDTAPSGVASVNFEAGEQRSNLVFVPIVGDKINVLCGAGSPSYILDVLGALE